MKRIAALVLILCLIISVGAFAKPVIKDDIQDKGIRAERLKDLENQYKEEKEKFKEKLKEIKENKKELRKQTRELFISHLKFVDGYCNKLAEKEISNEKLTEYCNKIEEIKGKIADLNIEKDHKPLIEYIKEGREILSGIKIQSKLAVLSKSFINKINAWTKWAENVGEKSEKLIERLKEMGKNTENAEKALNEFNITKEKLKELKKTIDEKIEQLKADLTKENAKVAYKEISSSLKEIHKELKDKFWSLKQAIKDVRKTGPEKDKEAEKPAEETEEEKG